MKVIRTADSARIPHMADRIPIACTLEGGQARRRWQAWNALMGRRLDFDRSPLHLTLRFAGDDRLRAELHELVAAEEQCCGFVAWEVKDLGDEVMITVRGDTDGVTAMAEAFGLQR